jgi:cyanate lyase
MPKSTRAESQELKRRIREAYRPGENTHQDVADLLGVTRPYVTSVLAEVAAAHRATAANAGDMLLEILELSELSVPDLGVLLNTSQQVIHRWLDGTIPDQPFFKRIELLHRALKSAAGQKADE